MLWISIALLGVAGCRAAAQKDQTSPVRRMLYVVGEVLPQGYRWQPAGHTVTDAVWVGIRLDRNGALRGKGAVLAAMEIHSRGKLTHHLLVGLTSLDAGTQVLTEEPRRTASQTALVQLVKDSPQITGLQLDFEYLPPQYADPFVSYIRELRAALPRDRTLHVAVFPPVGMPEAWRGFHNLPKLAAVSDGLVVMLYDHHRAGTDPGCVSGITWLGENATVLGSLPRHKVWLGAPLYGYRFYGTKATAISNTRFQKIAGTTAEVDGCMQKPASGDSTAFYPARALYEEYDRLCREYHFAGMAYWRAGLER